MPSQIESEWTYIQGLRAYKAASQPMISATAQHTTGGVLMLPMITGVGEQLRDWADSVAEESQTTVLVWDPWHGPSSDDSSLDVLRKLLSSLDDAQALAEINVLLGHMKSELNLDRITVVGWCLGGRYALLAGSVNPQVAGIVAMHPTITEGESELGEYDAIAAAGKISAPVVVHYPGQDHIVSRETFDRLQTALENRSVGDSILGVHPQAHHGFSDRRNHMNPENSAAFALAWPQALAFIDHTINRPVTVAGPRKGDNYV